MAQLEIWKDVVGYEGWYEISNRGNCRSIERYVTHYDGVIHIYKAKSKSFYTNREGYREVMVTKAGKRKRIRQHRLVAEAFLPNPENKPQVNHINGIKTDNRVENLEWATGQENMTHACENGLTGSKLMKEDIIEIRKLIPIMKQKDIAKIYNVTTPNISAIKRGISWSHLK